MLIVACQAPSMPDNQAEAMTRQFIDNVNAAEYDKAFELVGPDFFHIRAKDEWIAYYKAVKETMGPVISIKLSRKLTDDRLSGRFYMYQYSIKHKNGFTKEMVTMIQKINSNDPVKITAHKIESSKLLKINQRF